MATRVIAAQDKTTSGAGDDVQIKGGNANTSGAGGNIILSPGAQVTSGGDGSVRFVNPSNTGQYMAVAVSSSQVVFSLAGISDSATNIQINHNVYLPGKQIQAAAGVFGYFYMSGNFTRYERCFDPNRLKQRDFHR